MPDYQKPRDHMVDAQIARRGVRDAAVLKAMRTVPRERFVSDEMQPYAYDDEALPIMAGQTISQPYIVALMIEAAGVRPGDRVLEVGAGSGYAASILGQIAGKVFAIERHEALVESARERVEALGYTNIDIRTADGTLGLPEEAPFDAVIVSAAGPKIPQPLKDQLAIGGHLVIPLGPPGRQTLYKVTRRTEDRFIERDLGAVMFVPLISGRSQ